ncbi:MAG TPA: hypothetical protein VK249_11765, partial [Anaerolineales bacterium]|nr:hypothetical protein [Anaerolineales bacterium]
RQTASRNEDHPLIRRGAPANLAFPFFANATPSRVVLTWGLLMLSRRANFISSKALWEFP